MLCRESKNNIIQSVKTTYKNADKREWQDLWHTYDSEKQLITVRDLERGALREVTISSIYDHDIYSNGNRSGILDVEYNATTEYKAPLCCRRTEPGPGILLLVGSAVDDASRFSRTRRLEEDSLRNITDFTNNCY